ncbi:unnamed protein product [Danaus chrysippus]|uniref:(African queen) hypothetical protein n=1 Tax=Danaus chrysippus TaxID=151541 RepID=A0A8J2QDG4_9NEOP|nr:unnamed protein product [Danaus chrysippus]
MVLPSDGCVMQCDATLVTGTCIVRRARNEGPTIHFPRGLFDPETHKRHTLSLYGNYQSPISTIVLRTLDIITIVVPPALPAAMAAGIVYSQQRLIRNKVFCISPPRIIISGKLQVMCFDKNESAGTSAGYMTFIHKYTGTAERRFLRFNDVSHNGSRKQKYDNLTPAIVKPETTPNMDLQNLETYDPFTMEIEVSYEFGLIRRFHFSSFQRSMGVIARIFEKPQMVYYVKGAPEKIAGMCDPASLPDNFSAILNDYTSTASE